MSLSKIIYEKFWSNEIWWPQGLDWSVGDKAREYGIRVCEPKQLYYTPIFVIFMLITRHLVENFIAAPLGKFLMGKTADRSKPEISKGTEILEKIYQRNLKLIKNNQFSIENEIEAVKIEDNKQLKNWSNRRINRWFRRRRNSDRPDRVKKFKESFWRFTYFFFCSCYGYINFRNENFIKDPYNLWQDFPFHSIEPKHNIFYMIQLGFYGSLFITLFLDVKRKDFKEQIAHHIVTISLITGSFVASFWRIGILLMMLYDPVDWIIEISKMLVYCRYKKAADVAVGIFALTWIYTRCYLSIKYIVYTTVVVPLYHLEPRTFRPFPIEVDKIEPWCIFYLFNGFILTLQLLNFFWTWQLIKFAIRIITTDEKNVKDDRSDAEEYTDEE